MTQLDGMRGLAALFVFMSHLNLSLPEADSLQHLQLTPLGIFFGGQAAVDFFFVLSGFVLAYPFMRETLPADGLRFYGRFVLLRIARIYPAYWFALLFCLVAMKLFVPAGMSGTGPWAQTFWLTGWQNLTAPELIRHGLLIPDFDSRLIDPVSWTLVVEMRMSLLLPILILAFGRWGGRVGTPLLLLLAFALARQMELFRYLPMFAMGVALARHLPQIRLPGVRTSRLASGLLLAVALAAYGSPYIFHFGRPRDDYLAAGGAVLLIALALQPTLFGQLLKIRPVQFLGRVSYSFYLLHLPVFLLMLSWLHPLLHSVGAVFILALPVICLLSWLSFVGIERPALLLARRRLVSTPAIVTYKRA